MILYFFIDNQPQKLNRESGIIYSDNFPDLYSTNSNSSWEITVAKGKIVELTFHYVNVSKLIFNKIINQLQYLSIFITACEI